jgi:uridine phosphorylase
MHPTLIEGEQYHIRCKRGELARYLLVPGDPDRVPKIAKLWDEFVEVSSHREFRAFTGKYRGVQISAMSSGIGPAAMAILVNEAAEIGVETFVRVGSTGALQKEIKCGDLVISVGAVRLDGTSENYVRIEYPAVANHEVLLALIEAAESLGARYHVGITATSSDFYAGQARQSLRRFERSENIVKTLQKANVLNFEMECATLFVLSSLFGLRAGAICAVYANRVTDEFKPGAGEESCIKVAVEAVKILNEWDQTKKKKKKKWLHLSMLK